MLYVSDIPNNSQGANEGADMYGELMAEVWQRCSVVRGILDKKIPINEKIGIEIAYLQFRNICELIALACIAAHGDIAGGERKLQDRYQADAIIRRLTDLNPEFYPLPFKYVSEKGSPKLRLETTEDEPHLTKDDLVKLYRLSSSFLHIGAFSNLLDDRRPVYSLEDVEGWYQKILTLVKSHFILVAGRKYGIINTFTSPSKKKGPIVQMTGVSGFKFKNDDGSELW